MSTESEKFINTIRKIDLKKLLESRGTDDYKSQIRELYRDYIGKDIDEKVFQDVISKLKKLNFEKGDFEYFFNSIQDDPALINMIKNEIRNDGGESKKFRRYIEDIYVSITGDEEADVIDIIDKLGKKYNIKILPRPKNIRVGLQDINNIIFKEIHLIQDNINYLNIKQDAVVNIQCIDKIREVDIKDYIYNFYQVFSGINVDGKELLKHNIFSTILYATDQKNYLQYDRDYKPSPIYIVKNTGQVIIEGKNRTGDKEFLSNLMIDMIESQTRNTGDVALIPISMIYPDNEYHQIGCIVENLEEEITIAVYNPYGAIDLSQVIKFFNDIKPRLMDKYTKKINIMADKDVSQRFSIQARVDLPYCVMYTYLWFYLFYRCYKKIKKPMKYWLNLVEKNLTMFVIGQPDPVEFILKFSYFTVENMIKFLNSSDALVKPSAIEEIKKVKDYKNMASKDLSRLGTQEIIKILMCISLSEQKQQWIYTASCSDNLECDDGEVCLDRKCMTSPVYENIYRVTDTKNRDSDSLLKIIHDKNIKGYLDPDNNFVTYTDRKYNGDIVIDRDIFLKYIRSVKYSRLDDKTVEG